MFVKAFIEKRKIGLLLIIAASIYTCYYLTLTSNPLKHYGALSVIGLRHPILFAVWGGLTESALFINIRAAYARAGYENRYTKILLRLGLISILLTVFVPFDFDNFLMYIVHCYGAISFIVYHGIAMLILFFRFYKQKIYFIAGLITTIVLLTTLALFLIIGESGVLEVTPMFFSFFLLLLVNFSKQFKILKQKEYSREFIYKLTK